MRVDGENGVVVIDPDNESEVGHLACEAYLSTGHGVHGCAGGHDDVDASMDVRAIGPPSESERCDERSLDRPLGESASNH